MHKVFLYSGYFFDVHFPWFIVYLLPYFRCPCWLEMLWFCMITEHPHRERTVEKGKELEERSPFSREEQCGHGVRLMIEVPMDISVRQCSYGSKVLFPFSI